jgi:hypothetical protein
MNSHKFRAVVLLGALVGSLGLSIAESSSTQASHGRSMSQKNLVQPQEIFCNLPIYFIENRGQADPRVKFYTQGGGQTTWFTKEGITFTLSKRPNNAEMGAFTDRRGSKQRPRRQAPAEVTAVNLCLVGSRRGVKISALEPQEHKVNYFLGNNPKKWYRDLPTYQAVLYQEAYPGIDLKFYGNTRQLEYDIVIKPGADPQQVKFRYAGIREMEVTKQGDLAIKLPDGNVLLQKKPVVYQEIAGARIAREGKFKLRGGMAGLTYGFEVAAYDNSHTLVIDPVLVYSTYLGGSGGEVGHNIQVDSAGCAYVTGVTTSRTSDTDPFPTLNALTNAKGGGGPVTGGYTCIFISKFNAAGTGLIYSTYLGGKTNWDGTPAVDDYGFDYPQMERIGLAVDGSGCAYLTGPTWTLDFPTTPGAAYTNPYSYTDQYFSKTPQTAESFVTKLNSAGNDLVYSTYMRGDGNDIAKAISVENQLLLGNSYAAYITGYTESIILNPPPPTAPPPEISGSGFLTKLNPDGTAFLWTKGLGNSTPYGMVGEGKDVIFSGKPFSGGVWVTGETYDSNFPVVNALKDSNGVIHDHLIGSINAFVTWVDSEGVIRFSSYWGGGGINDYTCGYGITRGQDGNIYVCGSTNNISFPTTNAIQPAFGGTDADAVLFKITNQWSRNGGFPLWTWIYQPPQVVYSTYLGGDLTDEAYAVVVDQKNNILVTGHTNSRNFPLKNPIYNEWGSNAFVTKISYDGTQMKLLYSTFIGSGAAGYGIAVDIQDRVYVTGETNDNAFPLRNAYQGILRGCTDAFVTKLKDTVSLPWLMLLLD